MILDIILFVLLLAILGVLLLVLKRVAAIESPQTAQAQQEVSDTHPEEVLDFDVINEAFIAYIERESNILRLDDFGNRDYIGYESGYEKENNYRQIWVAAWLPAARNEIAAVISIQSNSRYFESHYKKFEEHKGRIKDTFSFEDIQLRRGSGNISQLYVVKRDVDLTQAADRDAAFRWLRETLEKLYWVLRVHDNLGWNTT